MRLAREFGTLRELLPDGVSGLADCPYALLDAIRSALVFLSFDELEADERPPRRLWRNPDKLNDWFDGVKRKREQKYAPPDQQIDDPVENELAREMLAAT